MKNHSSGIIILEALSIFLAILVWIGVMGIVNPIKQGRVVVPIPAAKNIQKLAEQNLGLEIEGSDIVYVSFDVKEDSVNEILSNDFEVYIDANELEDSDILSTSSDIFANESNKTMELPIHYNILNKKEKLVTNVKISPETVKVSLVSTGSQNYNITYKIEGEPPKSKIVGEVGLSPAKVYLEGSKDKLSQIKSVGIIVKVDKDSSDYYQNFANLIYYDENGEKLDFDDVKPNKTEIRYSVQLYDIKRNVRIYAAVTGKVADGYQYVETKVYPQSVDIAAPKSALDKISYISLPMINVDGISSSQDYYYKISDYLPAGTKIFGNEDEIAKVTVLVKKEGDRKTPHLDYQIGPNHEINYSIDGIKQSTIIFAPKSATQSEAE